MGTATDLELLARAVENPGQLCLGPTATSGTFPFGGLDLGFTRGMELRFDVQYQRSHDPASGRLTEVGRRTVENAALGCVLEGVQWDEDLIRAAFLKTTQSTITPVESIVKGSGNAGVVRALPPMLFTALDFQRGKSVYFPRPVLLLDLREAVGMAQRSKCGLPVIFAATATPGRDAFQVGRLENLVL